MGDINQANTIDDAASDDCANTLRKLDWQSILIVHAILPERYKPNYSLTYPAQARLPFEDFLKFYFKSEELSGMDMAARQAIAYNDSISAMLADMFVPAQKGHSSFSDFLAERSAIILPYFKKAYFSMRIGGAYVSSGMPPEVLWQEHINMLKDNFSGDDCEDHPIKYYNNALSKVF